jgi:hypothetical protein
MSLGVFTVFTVLYISWIGWGFTVLGSGVRRIFLLLVYFFYVSSPTGSGMGVFIPTGGAWILSGNVMDGRWMSGVKYQLP